MAAGSVSYERLESQEPAAGSDAGSATVASMLAQSSHPTVLLFHLGFRTAALLVYMFATWFTSNFILVFVLVVLLLSFDFWTVKNISGRLLVGLRWWNEIKDDGTNVWIFESRKDNRPLNPIDSRVFWYSMYLTPAVWALFGIAALFNFSFSWLLVVAVALALNIANLVGYTKCENDAKKRLQEIGGSFMTGLIANRLSSVFN